MNKFIKKLNDYLDKVEESLESPQFVNWDSEDNDIFGYFEVDNTKYRMELKIQIGNNWSYSFSYFDGSDWSYNISHKGVGGFKVLSTIKYGLYHLYDIKKPDSIIFSAIDNSDTRKRLYRTSCEEFCKEKGYLLSNRGSEKLQLFVMFNKNLCDSEKENVFLSVQKVIELSK